MSLSGFFLALSLCLCSCDIMKLSFFSDLFVYTFISFILACHSEEQSRLAARKYARVVQKLGFAVSHPFAL